MQLKLAVLAQMITTPLFRCS